MSIHLLLRAFIFNEKQKWNAAVQREMKSLHVHNTWESVELYLDKRVVDCKWVSMKNDKSTDKIDKIFKVRLIAKAFTQRKVVNYYEVFAPIAKYSRIQLLCVFMCFYKILYWIKWMSLQIFSMNYSIRWYSWNICKVLSWK